MKLPNTTTGGMSILGTLLLTVALVILVSNYFHIDLKAKYQEPQTQAAITETRGVFANIWFTYLKEPVTFLWKAFLDNMQRIHDGQPTDFQLIAPSLIPIGANPNLH